MSAWDQLSYRGEYSIRFSQSDTRPPKYEEHHGLCDQWLVDAGLLLFLQSDAFPLSILLVCFSIGSVYFLNSVFPPYLGPLGSVWSLGSSAHLVPENAEGLNQIDPREPKKKQRKTSMSDKE